MKIIYMRDANLMFWKDKHIDQSLSTYALFPLSRRVFHISLEITIQQIKAFSYNFFFLYFVTPNSRQHLLMVNLFLRMSFQIIFSMNNFSSWIPQS